MTKTLSQSITRGDIVMLRGFRVRVISIDHAVDQAIVQLGARQSIVKISDLSK